MYDVAPVLLKNIQDTFEGLVENDEALSRIRTQLEGGKASYADAQDYAGRIAQCLQKAYGSHLSSDSLPDGRMYYNIANRILPPTLNRCGGLVSDYCVQVQEAINEAANIGIKAQTAELNLERIAGLVNRVSEDEFEKTRWVLKAPVDNFCRSVVDDHVKANADFHYKSGLNPRIIRKTDGHCCKWCSARAGTYSYSPDMDREVFRRHENCGCTVEYDPGDGFSHKQDVWSKRWKNENGVEKKPIITGARILDPDTKESRDWAKGQYEEIRHRTTDCKKIAEKYGYKPEDIEKIKDYLFVSGKYYDAVDDIWRYFEPDAAIVQSWNRLSNDKSCLPHDLTLLKHEILEMEIKRQHPGIDHLAAHRRAEAVYNYRKESDEYYANRRKRFKKSR